MSLLVLGATGLAGSIGAVARYLLTVRVTRWLGSQFPFGTLVINISGSFLIGLLLSLGLNVPTWNSWQGVLTTGFLGGYTTFSTLGWETSVLLAQGNRRSALFNLGGSGLLGISSVGLGILLGRSVSGLVRPG